MGGKVFYRKLFAVTSILIIISLIFTQGSVFSLQAYPWEADELLAEQTYLEQIGAVPLWKQLEDTGRSPGEGVTVAVLDTGLTLTSDDLRDQLWINEAEQNGAEGIDDDGNGYVDDIHGANLVNNLGTTDSNGHGTSMAGLIGMQAGNGGGVGVAYGARIMPVKISKTRSFTLENIVEGINYAVDNGAAVICMSFGTYFKDDDLKQAIERASKKCLLIAAAGNESRGADCETSYSRLYPAAYPEVIGVLSVDDNSQLSDFSNFNSDNDETEYYQMAAPGEKLISAFLDNSYKTKSGTSQACALVAGAAAIFRSIYPDSEKYPPDVLTQMFLDSFSHKTVPNKLTSRQSRLLYLPDMMNACDTEPTEARQTVPTETQYSVPVATEPTVIPTAPTATVSTEPTTPTATAVPTQAVKPQETQPAKSKQTATKKQQVKKGSAYLAGSGSYKATYLVKNKTKRTVFYHRCRTDSKYKTATVPQKIKLRDGKVYKVIGISPKAFSGRKKIKKLLIRTRNLSTARVKNSLKSSAVSRIIINTGTKKQAKTYLKKCKRFFKKSGKKQLCYSVKL